MMWQTTKIGISVGKQRNSPDVEVSKLAKAVIADWKQAMGPTKKDKGPNAASGWSVASRGLTSTDLCEFGGAHRPDPGGGLAIAWTLFERRHPGPRPLGGPSH